MENLGYVLFLTATWIVFGIIKWRKRKWQYWLLLSMCFGVLNIGSLCLLEAIWGINKEWIILTMPLVIFILSQFITLCIMPMTGEEILKLYKLPIWHKTHSSDTRLEDIVREVQTKRKKYLYEVSIMSGAASQLYQLLRIKEYVHGEVFSKHTLLSIVVENITIREYQEMVLNEFHRTGASWIGTQKDKEVIKSLTDIYVTMYVANRMTGMPPKMDDGQFDIRSPYQKEMEWRRS